ncbi:MAG: lipopolysaccharide heptosyltransferase family protein, partial [Prochlorococcaceae cyanobacterium]
PETIRRRLPNLRTTTGEAGSIRRLAARIAGVDVVLASDPVCIELALLLGIPVVALGRGPKDLPAREGVQGIGIPAGLERLDPAEVLAALGLG